MDHSAADPEALFTVAHLARLTGDRYRDVSAESRARVLAWLEHQGPARRNATSSAKEGTSIPVRRRRSLVKVSSRPAPGREE
jgi:hypothetical protein